jgi:hypothetical protein
MTAGERQGPGSIAAVRMMQSRGPETPNGHVLPGGVGSVDRWTQQRSSSAGADLDD